MGLFKKKTEVQGCCECSGCSCSQSEETVNKAENAVLVLGGGCKKCHQLEENTKEALSQLGMDTTVDLITDFAKISAYGVMTTPALVVDGKVVSTGRVLSAKQAAEAIQNVRG